MTLALESLKHLHFNGLLLKYIIFEVRKYRGVMFDGTENWYKIWRKTDLRFLKWHEGFGKFSPEHALEKSPSWDFYGFLLSKVENVWAENLQKSYVSWPWRMMQNLKRNWIVSSNLTWEICWILTRALEKSWNFAL